MCNTSAAALQTNGTGCCVRLFNVGSSLHLLSVLGTSHDSQLCWISSTYTVRCMDNRYNHSSMDHNTLAGEKRGCCPRITNRGKSSLGSLNSTSCRHAGRRVLKRSSHCTSCVLILANCVATGRYSQIRGLSNPVKQLNRLFFQALSLGIGHARSAVKGSLYTEVKSSAANPFSIGTSSRKTARLT